MIYFDIMQYKNCLQLIFLSLLQDVVYHFTALLLYFGAFVLEAAITSANGGVTWSIINGTQGCITRPHGNIITFLDDRQYSINVAATVSSVQIQLKLSIFREKMYICIPTH